MALDPKPITLDQIDEGDYEGAYEPQPFIVVGDVPVPTYDLAAGLAAIAGFDDEETQTLKNTAGVIAWVTDTP